MSTHLRTDTPTQEEIERIPQSLRDIPRWTTWHYCDDRKVPTDRGGNIGKHPKSDPEILGPFEEIYASAVKSSQGIGFFFADDDIMGVDLDHCIDEDGNYNETAQYIVKGLNSYTEVTPSGHGLHVIVRASMPEPEIQGKATRDGLDTKVELYAAGASRYFTFTGQQDIRPSGKVEHRGSQIEQLYYQLEKRTSKDAESFVMPDEVGNGEWNNNFFPYACQLRQKGLSIEAMKADLFARAQRVNTSGEPIDKNWLDKLVDRVWKRYPLKETKRKKTPDQTAELLKLCDDFTYIHDAGPMREPYVIVNGKTLGESEISDILTDRFHDKTGRAPNAAALKASVDTIRVLCRKGTATKTYIRFANFRDVVYWDLANDAGEVIKITAEEISIIKNPPVVFRRTGKTLPLIAPGGTSVSFKKLADILNVNELQLTLIEAWCLSCFQPGGDLPILALLGEHGSIKTSVIEKLMSLLNPSKVPHAGLPETEKDCVVGARNAGIVAYDNVSGMSPLISDISCRIATGAGIATHTFYETVGETYLTVQVPQIFSGIGFITRADFADRCVTVTLSSLAAAGRKRKRKVLVVSDFTDLLPGLVRYLCETVQKGLKNLVAMEELIDEEPNLPRMADFASWAASCLGYEFLADYKSMSSERSKAILEDDQVARALIALLNRRVLSDRAVGIKITMSDLLAALNEETAGQAIDWTTWPKAPEKLSMRLMRLAPNLREEYNITFTKLDRTKAGQPWHIGWLGVQIVLPQMITDGQHLTATDRRYSRKAA